MTDKDTVKDGGPAFPGDVWYSNKPSSNGMTMRDWFAGQAMAGMCGNSEWDVTFEEMSTWGYNYADAMLAERAKSCKSA